MYFFFKPQK